MINPGQIAQKQKAEWRLKIIEEVIKGGKSITQVCKAHKISRKTFYCWKASYDQSSPEERLKNLENNNVKGFAHPRSISEKAQEEVLNIVRRHPEYSSHKISQISPEVGNHSVQKVLERNNLSLYEKRLIFQAGYLFFQKKFVKGGGNI